MQCYMRGPKPSTHYYVPDDADNVSPAFRNRVLSRWEIHKLRETVTSLEQVVVSHHLEANYTYHSAKHAKTDKAYWLDRANQLRLCARRHAVRLQDHLNALNAAIPV